MPDAAARVRKEDVDERVVQKKSLVPERPHRLLSPREFANLVGYLQSLERLVGALRQPGCQGCSRNRIAMSLNCRVIVTPPCICRPMTPSLQALGLSSISSVVTWPLMA